jgi:NADH-quinone oxidoreductase subunit M
MTQWLNALPTLITFAPLIGLVVLLFLPQDKTRAHRMVGIAGTLPSLVLALVMFGRFDPLKQGLQWAQSIPWFDIPLDLINRQAPATKLVFNYSMGVDGLSMPLVVLTCLVATLAAIASVYVKQRTKAYYTLLLLLLVGMNGVFLSANFFLFFIFFEVTLVAAFFLIGIWGFLGREKAANHFLLYNGLGSGFLLFAMIGLLLLSGSLDYATIQQQAGELVKQLHLLEPQQVSMVWLIFISLIVAFAIKLPMFPFHSWMLRVHVEAPTPVVMIHSGVLLKMGAYGLIRFGVGFFPGLMDQVATVLAVLGLVNILYGAILAFVETELKRVLAYSSVSHMGIILFGLAAMNEAGLKGAVFQSVSHGLISALLFFIVGSLYERTKTTELNELGGLAKPMPILSGLLLFGGMALLGLPRLSGFISEFMAFLGLFQERPVVAAVGALGLVLASAYTLRACLKTTFGPLKERFSDMADVKGWEVGSLFTLVFLIVVIGVYPAVLAYPMEQTLEVILAGIGG